MLNAHTLFQIMKIRAQYIRYRSIFVSGTQMRQVLSSLGATDEDLEQLRKISENLRSDPTLPFRRSRNGRFCLDPRQLQVFRLEFQPFILSNEEDFVRYDSGQVRTFDEIQDDLQQNTALQALFAFKFLLVQDVVVARRPGLDYGVDRWVCTLFNIRTVTNSELLGEPALEGVHSDGVDHTMTTFLGSNNMSDDSATTLLHNTRETNGKRWNKTDPQLLLGREQHREFLDTLLLVDHERKHSVSPVFAVDPQASATRDMLVFFTRKPTKPGHVSHPYDSMEPHPTLPMSAPLPRVAHQSDLAVAGMKADTSS